VSLALLSDLSLSSIAFSSADAGHSASNGDCDKNRSPASRWLGIRLEADRFLLGFSAAVTELPGFRSQFD
jgi:hypothetical protein